MKKILVKGLSLCMALSMAFSSAYLVGKINEKEVNAASSGYNLVWSDEFDGNSLDRSVWNVEVNGNGGGNQEKQYYTDRPQNIEVSGGTLKIKALKENYQGRQYTSGRITTQDKKFFKYGRMEAKMKLPSFTGSWPAFWMLGQNHKSVGWPKCGEIDIMEAINTEAFTHGAVHWSYNNSQADSGKSSASVVGKDFDRTQWHTYAIEWDSNQFTWYVDDKAFFTQSISTSAEMEEFRKEQFIIFNLAVGGQWPGFTIDDTAFPNNSKMEVDYVRVYQKEQETTTAYDGPTITVTEDAVEKSTGTWGSYFGTDWAAAEGTGQSQSLAKDGFTLNVSKVGNYEWGVQAFLNNLNYYPGNKYVYKCTLLSNINKTVFVKVAGDDDEQLGGGYVQLKANVPYEYETTVNIASDYGGVLDLYFGAGGNIQGDGVNGNTALNLTVSELSFVTTATIPDPSYNPPTTQTPTTQKPTTQTPTTQENTTQNQVIQTPTVNNNKLTPAKATIKSLKSSKKRSVKISIRKQRNVSGYIIRYSTNKKIKGYNTKKVKNTTFTFKKFKSKKNYYFKVRAFIKKNNKTYYGKWSKIKKVKVK